MSSDQNNECSNDFNHIASHTQIDKKQENEAEMEMTLNELERKVNESERKVNEVERKVNELETKLNESESKRKESERKVNELERKVNDIKEMPIEETNKSNWVKNLNFALVFVIVAIIFPYVHPYIADWPISGDASKPLPLPLDAKPVMLKNFRAGMTKLRQQFPSQTDRLWLVLEAATEPIIIQSDPTHPAVIMLVAAGVANNSAADCLAEQYAQLVTKTFQSQERHTVFDSHVSDDVMKPDQVKRELDNQFTHAFETGAKAGIVRHVEKLPGEAAMIFYRFCDNDNAPFKNVSVVLTLTLESNDPGNERDSVAYKELRSVWKTSLDVDKVEPLLSRIGNSVAFVRPESHQHLENIGCSVNDF